MSAYHFTVFLRLKFCFFVCYENLFVKKQLSLANIKKMALTGMITEELFQMMTFILHIFNFRMQFAKITCTKYS